MKTTRFIFAIFFVVIWCFALSGPGLSQDCYGALTYQISFPSGDTKDFTNATSFRGVGLDFRKAIDPSTTAGLFFGWNVFYQRTAETTELQTETPGAVTGTQDRYLNAFPMMVTVHRYFGQEGGPRPYVGLGGGGFLMVQRLEISLIALQSEPWEWGIAPEVGVVVQLQGSTIMIINGKYNYASRKNYRIKKFCKTCRSSQCAAED
jgi:outer membrane protein W